MGAIGRNLGQIGLQLKKPLILMVKADAYGHGALRVARAVRAEYYGVATEEEGIPLRELSKEVLVTAPSLSSVPLLRRYDMIPLIGDFEVARAAARASLKRCHIKVNSGMNRLGFTGEKECFKAAEFLLSAGVAIEGVATHYKEDSDKNVLSQNRAFDRAVRAIGLAVCEKGAGNRFVTHVTGSGALHGGNYDLFRVGLAAYGYHSGYYTAGIPLEPAMRVSSEIIKVKSIGRGDTLGYSGCFRAKAPRKAYTVLGGYGDGIARSEVGRRIIAAGRRQQIAAISMDSFEMISESVDLSVGDRVIILSKGVDAAYIAAHRHTIPYEVLLGYNVPRAEKVYVE